MDKSDIAGILGLLLGGAGGYYGGKKRGEREDKKLADYFDMMKELEGGSDGTTNVVSEGSGISTTGGDELLDIMTGKFSGSPAATDYLASYMDPNSPDYDPQSIFNPFDYFDGKGPIPFNPFKMNEGGRVGLDNGGLLFNALGGDKTGKSSKLTLLDALSNFQGSESILSMLASLANMGVGLNDGGRVGLANGGLGYSYKNNIFSADPSTGIPAVVDEGDEGVVNDTFIDLFPGLFPPVTDPVETIIDTPAVPMGGGGGDGFKFSSNAYSANPDGTIGFQNPAYDGILGDEYKDRPIGDEFTLGTSPLSDYGDIFNPNEIGVPSKKKGFFDAYGKFVGSDDMPLGTLPGAQFQDFMTDDEGKFDFTKVIPGYTAFKTLDNFIANALGFKTDTDSDSDPEKYDKVKDPMKAFKDMSDAAKQQGVMTEKELAAEAAEAREKLKNAASYKNYTGGTGAKIGGGQSGGPGTAGGSGAQQSGKGSKTGGDNVGNTGGTSRF